MKDNNNAAIWEPGETVYQAGDIPKEAYLILEGYVNIETKDGLKLNRIGMGEIFGETSILLDLPRTVTAKVCTQKLVAKKIPKSYFTKLNKTNMAQATNLDLSTHQNSSKIANGPYAITPEGSETHLGVEIPSSKHLSSATLMENSSENILKANSFGFDKKY